MPTTPSDPRQPWQLLYDGSCGMCCAGAALFLRLCRPGSIDLRNFRIPGEVERFPALSRSACEQAMHLVSPDGSQTFVGAAAVVAALETRPAWKAITWLYRAPGLHQLANWAYRRLANNRFVVSRVLGLRPNECASGACKLHDHVVPPQNGHS